MAPSSEPPVVLVKWYELSKWLLARIESFPKSQRFVFGQRLAGFRILDQIPRVEADSEVDISSAGLTNVLGCGIPHSK